LAEAVAELDKVQKDQMEVIHLHPSAVQLTLHKVAAEAEDLHQTIQDHQELITVNLEDPEAEAEEEAITLKLITLEDLVINQVYQTLDQT
jgi:hypothetical protein